jgi:hypothetical protein
MATRLRGDLPDPLREIRTRPLFVMRLDVRPLQIVGGTPGVYRRIGVLPGGTFDGEPLSGEVLEGGNDWQAVREDGSTTLDVRLVLKTTNGALIEMTYCGNSAWSARCHCSPGEGRGGRPAEYYFRIAPLFETASEEYSWINNIIAIGIGQRRADGPIYSVFEVL